MANSKARDSAMRLLYEREMGGEGVETCIEDLMEVQLDEKELAYVRAILDGVREKGSELDSLIENFAIGWSLPRIAKVDLSILRLAINEAVELSHVYSTPEAAAFINGILGSVARSLEEDKT